MAPPQPEIPLRPAVPLPPIPELLVAPLIPTTPLLPRAPLLAKVQFEITACAPAWMKRAPPLVPAPPDRVTPLIVKVAGANTVKSWTRLLPVIRTLFVPPSMNTSLAIVMVFDRTIVG